MKKLMTRLLNLPMEHPEQLVLGMFILIYMPFLGEPVVRTTGDEKVYIAQAMEMASRGSWFVQTLAEQPNYYKGPLHYILIRIGMMVFGPHSLWGALWMNGLALASVSYLLTRKLRSIWPGQYLPFVFGSSLIFAPGICAHMFASQMEIELLAVYGFVLYFCLRLITTNDHRKNWLLLWLTIGLASWFKSPVHSVLLGSGILCYALLLPELRAIIPTAWGLLAMLSGGLLGILAYGIPWLLDPENFYQTYILRETIGKGPNGVGVFESVLPNITYQIWPHVLMLAAGTCALWNDLRRKTLDPQDVRILGLALVIALPTFGFFAWHPYRSAIYSLPALPAVLLWACVGWRRAVQKWPKILAILQKIWLITALIPALLVLALQWRFHPGEEWLPSFLVTTSVLVLAVQLAWVGYALTQVAGPRLLAWSWVVWVPAMVTTLSLMKAIGVSDMQGFKQFASQQSPGRTYGYYNVQKFVWSEWGCLNFTAELPVKGLHRMQDTIGWIKAGHPLIVPSPDILAKVKQELGPDLPVDVVVWKRWQSHGEHNSSRNPRQAWKQADLDLLRGEYYIVTRKS